jgi:DNA-binding transcriptional regulator YiaG
MRFCQELQKKKEELAFSQKEMCDFLYEVPHRTLQSWLRGEKEPPLYVQRLVMFKLCKA